MTAPPDRRSPRSARARVPRLLDPLPVVLDAVPLRIDPVEVRAFHGYKPPSEPPVSELDERLEAARAEVAAVVQPRLAYRAVPVTRTRADELLLEGGSRLRIPHIERHWGCVEAVVVGVATVGTAPEALRRARGRAGDRLGGSLLDVAASAAVECVAEWANDYLCQLGVAAGLRVTNRISPGLAGWDLGDQATLFRLCPAGALGVRLRPDGTMTPTKTISFLVGVGRAARVDHYFVQCRRCWAEACPARRVPAVTTVHAG